MVLRWGAANDCQRSVIWGAMGRDISCSGGLGKHNFLRGRGRMRGGCGREVVEMGRKAKEMAMIRV